MVATLTLPVPPGTVTLKEPGRADKELTGDGPVGDHINVYWLGLPVDE